MTLNSASTVTAFAVVVDLFLTSSNVFMIVSASVGGGLTFFAFVEVLFHSRGMRVDLVLALLGSDGGLTGLFPFPFA